jgi:hypothetical protein
MSDRVEREREAKSFCTSWGRKNLRRLVFREQTGSHEQRSQVFFQHPALPMQVCQESPQMRSIDPARGASYFQFCQEVIELFDLQLGKGNAVFFKVSMERGKKAFDLSEVVERSSVRQFWR